MTDKTIQLTGRVFIQFDIRAVTGLHIGGSDVGIEIGGVDKTVIREALSNRPYIPGSSLKGKMRSLTEKYLGLKQNQPIGQGYIHSCDDAGCYPKCDVCQVYGVPGERDFGTPTRLIVRDVRMTEESAGALEQARTDLPYSEVKTEVSIDRVTAKANPRQLERVPAGVVFGPAELVYSLYDGDGCNAERDVDRLRTVLRGLQLLEDDYLGGQGSRGSGRVRLERLRIGVKTQENYGAAPAWLSAEPYPMLADLLGDEENLIRDIKQRITPSEQESAHAPDDRV